MNGLIEPRLPAPLLYVPPETPSTSQAASGGEAAPRSGRAVEDVVPGEAALAEATTSTAGSGESPELGSGEDALAQIRRLIAERGMTALVQREQSTTMASIDGFGNNIIVSHRIHRGSQTAAGASSPPDPLLLAPQPAPWISRPSVLDEDSVPSPSSSLLLSSPSPPPISSHSPIPSGGGGSSNSYPGDPYSR